MKMTKLLRAQAKGNGKLHKQFVSELARRKLKQNLTRS